MAREIFAENAHAYARLGLQFPSSSRALNCRRYAAVEGSTTRRPTSAIKQLGQTLSDAQHWNCETGEHLRPPSLT